MDTERIEQLLEEGKGYKEIGQILGEDRERVRSYARKMGIRPVVKRSPWREWEEVLAKQLLAEGKSFEEIAKLLPGRSPESIKDKQYHKWRVPLRKDLWTAEEEEKAKELLLAGAKYEKVAEVFGRTRDAVKIRNGNKWKIRVPHGNNLLPVDDFFDTWTPYSSYALGFLVSDGCIDSGGRSVIWSQSHDFGKAHLEKLLPLVGGNIYGPCKKGGYRVCVYSRPMVARLAELGIGPNKSLTVTFPDVPAEYMDHFVRGLLDGDGCVRDPSDKRRNERPRVQVQIASGSPEFRHELKNRLESLGFVGRESKIELIFNMANTLKIAPWIWGRKAESLWLERKFLRFEEILSARESCPDKRLHLKRDVQGRILGSS